MAEVPELRIRNLQFAFFRVWGEPIQAIARYAGVSTRTVRRGIADAATYRRQPQADEGE